MITPKKWEQIREKMRELEIKEEDLDEKFILGSGHGGQKLHKTQSTVFLKHRPTAIQVKCQLSRSRDDNRYYARKLLCEKIDYLIHKEKSEKQALIHKIKKQKKKRSKKAKQKILNEKHKQADRKKLRKVSLDE